MARSLQQCQRRPHRPTRRETRQRHRQKAESVLFCATTELWLPRCPATLLLTCPIRAFTWHLRLLAAILRPPWMTRRSIARCGQDRLPS